uniref:Reverse transcriptase Ty1/copia-type domain-containing protein n=1 Tax=Solanum lycopersicum TaxID=4081 RepID=A0A3Q7GHU4_SOLLC
MYPSSMHDLWDRCNAIVLGWIMNSVSKGLLSTVIYGSDAHRVWEDLRERFDKVNASRAFFLHKEIVTLSQGTASVSSYFSRLRELWDEFETLMPPPSCACVEAKFLPESVTTSDTSSDTSVSTSSLVDSHSLSEIVVGKELLVILVYVDDLLVTDSNLQHIQQVRKDLQHTFKMKDLGELKYFLGIEFSRTNYEDTLLDDFGKYQRLIGRLLYLTMTRPDLAFVVQMLSQFMHSPKTSHMEAVIRVVKYIKGTAGLRLFMPSSKSSELTAYCESNWAACVESRRSVTGYVVKFGDAAISCKTKKQNTVSRSSAEAEFRSMATTVAEIIHTMNERFFFSSQISINGDSHQKTLTLDIIN